MIKKKGIPKMKFDINYIIHFFLDIIFLPLNIIVKYHNAFITYSYIHLALSVAIRKKITTMSKNKVVANTNIFPLNDVTR